jgi:hypothetical protein
VNKTLGLAVVLIREKRTRRPGWFRVIFATSAAGP